MSLKNLAIYLSNEEFDESAPGAEVVRDMELEVPAPDADITEETVAAAVEDAELAADDEAEAAAQMDEAGTAYLDAEEEQASVEHYVALLRHGLKHKQYSPQFATLAQDKMEKLGATLQMPMTVGLEHYGADAGDMAAYYTASLETFTGFGKRLGDLSKRISESINRGMENVLFKNGRKKAVVAINAQADALLSELGGKAGADKAEVNAAGVAKALSVGKKFPGTGLLAAVSNDQRLTSVAISKGFADSAKFVGELSGCIDGATTSGGPGKTGEWVTKAGNAKSPHASFPAEAFSTGLMGGFQLEGSAPAGGGDARATIKQIGKLGLPVVGSNRGTSGDAKITLSKADIVNLIKSAKVYAAMAEKVVNADGGSLFTNLRRNTEKYERWVNTGDTATWTETKNIGYLVDQMPMVIWKHFQLYRGICSHCTDTAEALLKLAKQAIKASA